METEEAFGVILREARLKSRLSQDTLAHKAGVDRTFISLLERGKRQPTLKTILQLANALDTSAAALVSSVEQLIGEV